MKSLLIPLLFALSLPAQAEVDPKIHKMCLKASDYSGCVNTQMGSSSIKSTPRMTVDLDKIKASGNKCPAGWAYFGGGSCQRVKCGTTPFCAGKNDERLAGKGWSCKKGFACVVLKFDFKNTYPIRATFDQRCPDVEPEIGRNNSCQNGLTEEVINTSQPPIGMEYGELTGSLAR